MRYAEWESILEQEEDCQVYDPDGMRAVVADDKENALMTREEAMEYFIMNTLKKNELKERANHGLR